MKISFGFHQLHDFAHGTITVLSFLPLPLQEVTKIHRNDDIPAFFPCRPPHLILCVTMPFTRRGYCAHGKQRATRTILEAGMPLTNTSIVVPCSHFAPVRVRADKLRNDNVVITSKRRHFDVITSKWHRFDVITTLLLRHMFSGVLQTRVLAFYTKALSRERCDEFIWNCRSPQVITEHGLAMSLTLLRGEFQKRFWHRSL